MIVRNHNKKRGNILTQQKPTATRYKLIKGICCFLTPLIHSKFEAGIIEDKFLNTALCLN
jgi:hypothetical protein